jgi:hypothetical protein
LPLIDRTFRLADDFGNSGLKCTSAGVSLAGVPLLLKTSDGFEPRSAEAIDALMKSAYGQDGDVGDLSAGLAVIAKALNDMDLGRAMVAALRLRLPQVNQDGAARIAKAHQALVKYDPDQPRDEIGRWISDGDVMGDGTLKPTLISNMRAANDNFTERACLAASKQCQVTALSDKSRTPYFSRCQEMEDVCLFVQLVSRIVPEQSFGIIFPDRTLVKIEDGTASVLWIGGVKLPQPLQ